MFSPSPLIIHLLQSLAGAMTAPTFAKALTLLAGTILTPGRRTITAALTVLGLQTGQTFGKYHRVLSRAAWSPMVASRLLLGMLVTTLVPAEQPLVVVIDETLERRRGKRIRYKGWWYDAVRSVGQRVAVTLGIRWSCLALLVRLPWSARPWALPFAAVPVLSAKTCQQQGKRHRSGSEWAAVWAGQLRRWFPGRPIVLVGDGE